ncbi:enoyl-CoA hydratase/isomerase family protein [Ectothiorhodospiraceae bacterium WFHF3C12]|nr:enoyl-CoA hydratase/isomerase family protein [Ectothiorhodospiraceae bacterium WFHF3C12]
MSYETIQLQSADGVARLTLNLPDKLNPLTLSLQHELRDALRSLRQDPTVAALVITGGGKAFSSGADLTSMNAEGAVEGESLGQSVARTMRELMNQVILDITRLEMPVVAAVNGPAAGAGASLALAADVVVAGRSAYFLLPFMPNLGIVPDLGATWHLPRLIGRARATALTLLGERLPAERAAEWGLIWRCVEDEQLMDTALELGARLAQLPAHGATEVRQAYRAAEFNSLADQLEYETSRQEELLDRETFSEGVRAFREKRAPRFR